MHLELAVATDLPALHSLVESAYRGDSARAGWTHEADLLGGQRTDLAALQTMLDDPAQRVLVLRDGDRLDACVALANRGNGTVYVGMVTVAPRLQARGLGRLMLSASEEQAVRLFGATRIEMTVISQRTELIAWYERRGYRLSGERRPFPADDPRFGLPRRDDLEFIVLEKPL